MTRHSKAFLPRKCLCVYNGKQQTAEHLLDKEALPEEIKTQEKHKNKTKNSIDFAKHRMNTKRITRKTH